MGEKIPDVAEVVLQSLKLNKFILGGSPVMRSVLVIADLQHTFRELGMNSIDMEEVIMAVEDAVGHSFRFPDEIVDGIKGDVSVMQFVDHMQDCLNGVVPHLKNGYIPGTSSPIQRDIEGTGPF